MKIAEFVEWLSGHMMPCFWKRYLGIDCPFCGFQRALVALLKGDIWNSITLFPALLPLLATAAILVIRSFLYSAIFDRVLRAVLVFDIVIIVCNFILKNVLNFLI